MPFAASGSLAFTGFMAMLGLWVLISGAVIVSRIRYDRRERRLMDLSRDATDGGPEAVARSVEVRRILSGRSRRAVYRMVATPEFPPWLTAICAEYAVEHIGLERIKRDASQSRPWRKWQRISALTVLGRIRAPDAHAILEVALCGEDAEVSATGAKVLHDMGDREAAVLLVSALKEAAVPASRVATYLDAFPVAIPDLLRPLVSHASPQVRYWATSLLCRYPDYEAVGQTVAPLVHDPDPAVRKAALLTLDAMEDETALEPAIHALEDPVAYVRAVAVRIVGRQAIAPRNAGDGRLIGRIASFLGDQAWDVRQAAKESLVDLGPEAWRAISPLLDSPDEFARNGAAEVLQNMRVLDWALHFRGTGVDLGAELNTVVTRAFAEGGAAMEQAVAERTSVDPDPGGLARLAGHPQ